jgi:hypothetical protein
MTSEAEKLVGTWRLISWEEREVGGGVNHPLWTGRGRSDLVPCCGGNVRSIDAPKLGPIRARGLASGDD